MITYPLCPKNHSGIIHFDCAILLLFRQHLLTMHSPVPPSWLLNLTAEMESIPTSLITHSISTIKSRSAASMPVSVSKALTVQVLVLDIAVGCNNNVGEQIYGCMIWVWRFLCGKIRVF